MKSILQFFCYHQKGVFGTSFHKALHQVTIHQFLGHIFRVLLCHLELFFQGPYMHMSRLYYNAILSLVFLWRNQNLQALSCLRHYHTRCWMILYLYDIFHVYVILRDLLMLNLLSWAFACRLMDFKDLSTQQGYLKIMVMNTPYSQQVRELSTICRV